MKRYLAAAAAMVAFPAAAAVEHYTIDPRHTYPAWEIQHMGISIQRGRFDKTEGKIAIDPEARRGTIEVSINVASVDTADKQLDEQLRGEKFFKGAQNPQITFRSSDLTFEGDQVKRAQGELTMAGITKPVTLEAGYFACGTHPMVKRKMCGGDFTARIKRSDWGISYGIPAVADDVLLRINVEALKDD